MKKALSLIVALVMVFACFASLAVSVSADEVDNREFTVYMVTTAPTIDGIIDDGEYPLVTSWPDDTDMAFRGDYVQNIEAYFYMCYDADYLYYAVKTECDAPHVAMKDDATAEVKHYVFNAHHLMSLIIPDDPTKDIYPDSSATWSDLYNGGFCYEWTMIYTSEAVAGVHEANETFATDHFGNLIAGGNATYATGSDGDWDTYEIKIPWGVMSSSKQTTPLTGTEGTVFGMDFTIGLTNINEIQAVIDNDGYDAVEDDAGNVTYYGNYLYLADCYPTTAGKALNGCAIMILGGEYTNIIDTSEDESSVETSVETSAETSTETSAETSEPTAPPTGDTGFVALAIISVIALAGVVVIKRK